ncbi:hypothetical protein GGR53DRAFT_205758 [Hypoxylon sp. FL1150]|nr:hypothetical protein GGR53DRAFT_205758 [Hypoxylon sp. FL1150]
MDNGETEPSAAYMVITSGAVLITTTALAIAARVTARWRLKTSGVDDVLILVSWVLSLGLISTSMASTQYGLGSPRDQVSDENYSRYLKFSIAQSITYSWSMPAAKASFAVLYLRIFPDGRLMTLVNKILIAFLFAQALTVSCLVLFRCSPVRKSWDFELEGSCFDLQPLYYATFILNAITSFILFIEPIPSTWKLQISLVKRLGLVAMLSLGLLVTAISVIRIVFIAKMASQDTYDIVKPLVWSEVEVCGLIICSCIPAFRQVAAMIPGLNSALGLSSGKESNKYYNRSTAPNLSIPLQSRTQYSKSQKSRTRGWSSPIPFGVTTHTMATVMDGISENDSQEEIFPHSNDQGAIVVTTEVQRHVEDNAESAKTFTLFTDGLPQQDENASRHSSEKSGRNSTNKSGADANWLRRSRS